MMWVMLPRLLPTFNCGIVPLERVDFTRISPRTVYMDVTNLRSHSY
jgi:hypothetical protein